MREKKNHNQHHRNTNNYKKILWKIICQQTGQPGRNGWTPRNIQTNKSENRKKQKLWIDPQ